MHSPKLHKTSNKISQTNSSAFTSSIDNFDMTTSILSSIEKLKGRENYSSWKFSIENYLELEGLSKCITGDEDDEKKNAKAKAAIVLSLDKMNFVHVKSAKTVQEVWKNLQSTFEDKGTVRKVTLMRRIVNTKLDNCDSMDAYVTEIISTSQKLSEAGFEIPDEWLAIFLLSGLSDDYLPMIMAMENSNTKLSSDCVKVKLLQESTSTVSGATENALFAKNKGNFKRRNNIICFSCRQRGHKSFQCKSNPKAGSTQTTGKDGKIEKNTPAAFSAVFLSSNFDANDWYLDSGATRHMTRHVEWISKRNGEADLSAIRAANGQLMEVKCSGMVEMNVRVEGKPSVVQLFDVLCVPKLTTNLISVSETCSKQKVITFSSKGCVIESHDGHQLATGSIQNGLYRLDIWRESALASIESNSMNLWHRRLGHLNLIDLKKMRNGVTGISFNEIEDSNTCVVCCKGKQSRKPFKKSNTRATQLLEIVHADLAGKMECVSVGGSKFCLVIVDDYSRRTFVYMLKHKNETFDKFCVFKKLVENQTGLKIKIFRSDNGTEFINNKFKAFFDNHGIQHQTSITYTPQQNGLAERTIRTISEKARCMLMESKMPKKYWAEALNTAAYVKNHIVTPVLGDKSPIEIWTGKKPDVSHFKVFGSLAMAMIPDEKRRKFDSKSRKLTFVGYCENQKGYRLMNLKTNEIVVCRDVKFIETGNKFFELEQKSENFKFIPDFNETESSSESEQEEETTVVDNNLLPTQSSPLSNNNSLSNENSPLVNDTNVQSDISGSSEIFADASDGDSTFVSDETVDIDDDSDLWILRRSQRETKPPERFQSTHFAFCMYESIALNHEPVTVHDALSGSECENWKAAMEEEYRSLIDNGTWTLVDLPAGCRAINNKWVFKRKSDVNGKIVRYKARLVAKGCSQREGVDFVETFSPVVRYSSIRLLVAIASKYSLKIEQMDVVTAFLHGDIKERVYMKQPEAYNDDTERVCLLKKSLYGLKQASRQWNIKLNDVLQNAGFTRCIKDACIYVRRNGNLMVIVAVYVDDLLIFFNHNIWKDQLKSTLTKHFKMKDLGIASNILGIRIEYDDKNGTISLSQRKYTEAILRKFKMFDCDPVKLPFDPNQKLTKEMMPTTDEEIKRMCDVPYQEAVGSVLYLAQCTRPDICNSIAIVSQFNQNPGIAHWKAVKRILRYLKEHIRNQQRPLCLI